MKHLNYHLVLKLSHQIKQAMPYLFVASIFLLLFSGHSFAADGTDYLFGVSTSVGKSFGEGSTFEKLLYMGEAVVGAFAYIKTKNILVLGGVVVLMIFTHFFFGSILAS